MNIDSDVYDIIVKNDSRYVENIVIDISTVIFNNDVKNYH